MEYASRLEKVNFHAYWSISSNQTIQILQVHDEDIWANKLLTDLGDSSMDDNNRKYITFTKNEQLPCP